MFDPLRRGHRDFQGCMWRVGASPETSTFGAAHAFKISTHRKIDDLRQRHALDETIDVIVQPFAINDVVDCHSVRQRRSDTPEIHAVVEHHKRKIVAARKLSLLTGNDTKPKSNGVVLFAEDLHTKE